MAFRESQHSSQMHLRLRLATLWAPWFGKESASALWFLLREGRRSHLYLKLINIIGTEDGQDHCRFHRPNLDRGAELWLWTGRVPRTVSSLEESDGAGSNPPPQVGSVKARSGWAAATCFNRGLIPH